MFKNSGQVIVFLSWLLALTSTAGSLFFSEVMMFPPCVLCWYQRMAMYPLVIIFFVGSFQGLRVTTYFSLPFVGIGWLVSIFHNLLHWGVIPESASPCIKGVSCSTVFLNWFGFVTIPLLALTSFSLLGILQWFLYKESVNEK